MNPPDRTIELSLPGIGKHRPQLANKLAAAGVRTGDIITVDRATWKRLQGEDAKGRASRRFKARREGQTVRILRATVERQAPRKSAGWLARVLAVATEAGEHLKLSQEDYQTVYLDCRDEAGKLRAGSPCAGRQKGV